MSSVVRTDPEMAKTVNEWDAMLEKGWTRA
jgi:hypothetical protein